MYSYINKKLDMVVKYNLYKEFEFNLYQTWKPRKLNMVSIDEYKNKK